MEVTEIKIKVKAGAKHDRIEGWITENENKILKVSIKQIPEEGKANKAIIKFLSKTWKVPQKNLVISSGLTSNYKTIIISTALKLRLLE
ncbi:MAG: DUF167 domain-containing protein [Pseudomonadota bacterium]